MLRPEAHESFIIQDNGSYTSITIPLFGGYLSHLVQGRRLCHMTKSVTIQRTLYLELTPHGCLLFLHDVVPCFYVICLVTLLDQKAQMMPFSSKSFLTTTIELFSIIRQLFSHHTHSVKLLKGKWVTHRAEAFMYYFQAYLESQIVYHCQLVSFYLCTHLQDLVLFTSSSQTTLLKQIPHISLDELIRVPTG